MEFLQGVIEFAQGTGVTMIENIAGLKPPDNNELENKRNYQAGKLTGHVLSEAWSIVEMFAGLTPLIF